MQLLKKQGFTLIELLVVVLIIGILAAVALPQYQKAVAKSRLVQVLPTVRAVYEAQKLYYLENGTYADNVADLSVDFTCPSGWTCVMGKNVWENNSKAYKVEAYRTNPATLGVNYYYGPAWLDQVMDKMYCWAIVSDSRAVDVCKSMGPELLTSAGFARYLIQ